MNLLTALFLQEKNSAASVGKWWSTTKNKGEIISVNPSTGQAIASIFRPDQSDYEYIIQSALSGFNTWKSVPAPKRGECIRMIGEVLRQHKDELGSLISLEMGKSKQEGDGEVQEMIDMADLAIGQSRMLFGKNDAFRTSFSSHDGTVASTWAHCCDYCV